MVNYIWYFLQILIGYQLVFPIVLYCFYKIVPKPRLHNKSGKQYDYAIIVTAYQQTDLLPSVVASLLALDYSNYLIYIVADHCDISKLEFTDDRVVLLRPEETLANNVKSHFYAISHFKGNHELLTIIDSDNLVEPDYLQRLNLFFDNGFEAVQGVRKSKELSTTLAALDAARDYYYHFYDGKVLFALGSSATLAGSGMAFTVPLYKSCFENVVLEGAGFDKVLQAQLLLRNKQIAFAEDAVVYDEKTANSVQLVNQRARWINTWFKYFRFGFQILRRGVMRADKNQFIFGFVLLRPPLFMFLLLSVLCLFINLLINPVLAGCWFVALALFVLGFYIALWDGHADKKIYKSLVNIPKFIFLQLAALLHVRSANKKSVATTHVVVSEEKKD
ncbi:cellulose synthase/poly-beta-1,6-N-acetylglucosamine synthase-like glycosyltransferase [Pedobacter sp. UYP30]|uniref:glycosyltransferase n=1 Tax=Pedobacter sp. UYP30 TaxID=1756400 RepID=UPI00339B202B